MLEKQADFALADEHVDALLVLAPATTQHLDSNHSAVARIFGAIDAAETSRLNLVQQPIPAQDEAVEVALKDFAALPRRQIAFTLESGNQVLEIRRITKLVVDLCQLALTHQAEFEDRLLEIGGFHRFHSWPCASSGARKERSSRMRIFVLSFYLSSSICQAKGAEFLISSPESKPSS